MGVSRRSFSAALEDPWASGSDLLQVARFAKMGGSQSSDAPEEAPEEQPEVVDALELPADPKDLPYFDSEIGFLYDKAKKHAKAYKMMVGADKDMRKEAKKFQGQKRTADEVRAARSLRKSERAAQNLDPDVLHADDQIYDEEESLLVANQKVRDKLADAKKRHEDDERRKPMIEAPVGFCACAT